MITISEFENFIQNDIVYQQRLLYYIDDLGRQIPIENLGQLHSNYGKTIKMEGVEKLNRTIFNFCNSFGHKGPVTCHIFRSFPDSYSFPMHQDPDDVLLVLTEGTKDLIIKDTKINLKAGDRFFINAGTSHQAFNTSESLLLSIGFEKFLSDKI
jgi:mannose-6-phosphate isomerase-like protein (cupin superfamily)